MHVHVTVELDGDDLVVVKSATSPDAIAQLRAEAARLECAAHPGVVNLVAAGPGPSAVDPAGSKVGTGFELRLAHAGEPVTTWAPTPGDLAGVAAALATTLADLHDAGIVHGRVEAAHVLLGGDGHPRLCGLAGAPGATPEEDVAGWGRLVADLAGRSRGTRRGMRVLARGRDRDRRALVEVAGRATDPVPERRPTARALADAVVSAVPEATLPGRRPGAGVDAARARSGRSGGSSGGGEVDTLDRIWSWAGEPSEDERWAAVFGASPTRADVEPVDLPLAHRPALGWDVPDDGGHVDGADPSGDGDDVDPRPDDDLWAAGRDSGTHDDATWTRTPTRDGGTHDDATRTQTPTRDGGTHDDATRTRTPTRDDDMWAPGRDSGTHDGGNRTPSPTRDGGTHDDGTDLPARGHPPVGRARRRPVVPAPAAPAASAARRGRAVAVAAGVAAVLVAGAWAAAAARERAPGSGTRAPGAPSPRAGCPPVAAPAADVDDDGCREALVLDGGTLDAGVAAWTIGEAGDLVTLGDWDCDGEAAPAVLRPATGDVFVFSEWAALDEPLTVPATGQVPGGRAIRAEPAPGSACDRLVVERTDGTPEEVEVGGGG